MKKASHRRITTKRWRRVTATGVCPGCGDHIIVSRPRLIGGSDALDRPRFGGAYLCCAGPDGHKCWNMTSNVVAVHLYETFGPESRFEAPSNDEPARVGSPAVIKRPKAAVASLAARA